MRPNRVTRLTAATAGLVMLLGIGLSGPAWAGGEARAQGTCSRSADWELRARARNGGIEIRFEVDSSGRGQRWIYTIRRDGTPIASGARISNSSSASFRVERTVADAPGTNRITATARNPRTREYCRATVTL